MQIGEYFKLSEFLVSQTATRRGISNDPPREALAALAALCANVLDPLRERLGRPIFISSGYRSQELNRAVGGSLTSQHCAGEAADFTVPGVSLKQVFDFIRTSNLPFDQLIFEGSWLHISYSKNQQRGQCLIAHFADGKVRYESVARSARVAPSPQSNPPIEITQAPAARNANGETAAPIPASQSQAMPPVETVLARIQRAMGGITVSRIVGIASALATALAAGAALIGDANPVWAAKIMAVSGLISAFCGRIQGAPKTGGK